MPEVDHRSAAAKYFLTRSLVVRTGLLVLAGPNSGDQALRSIRQIELIETRFAWAHPLCEKSTSSPKRSWREESPQTWWCPCPVFCSMSLPVSFLFYVRCLSISLHASDTLALVAFTPIHRSAFCSCIEVLLLVRPPPLEDIPW